jgi:hypothetical protein
MSAPLAAAKRAQADGLRAQAAGLDLEAVALEGHATPEADPLLTLLIAAALVGVTRRALRDAIRRGELAGYGRPVVVRRSEVLAWLEGRKVRSRVVGTDADAAYLALVGGAS